MAHTACDASWLAVTGGDKPGIGERTENEVIGQLQIDAV
jgi:hypothetical protein